MEVLKISEGKLKIMLTKSDMQKFGLNCADIDYNDQKTKKSFFEILDLVKSTHGFDTEGDKVLIQFYPSKDGGCELFVTKLGLIPPASEKSLSRSDKVTMLSTKREVFRFERREDLALAAKLIIQDGQRKYSEVFFERERGIYYLEIMERVSASGGMSPFDRVLEFGERMDASLFPYITEHCEKLTAGSGIEDFCAE